MALCRESGNCYALAIKQGGTLHGEFAQVGITEKSVGSSATVNINVNLTFDA